MLCKYMLSSPGKTFCMKKKGIKGKKWIAAVLLPVFLTAGCGRQGKVETYPDIAEPEAQITFFGNKYEPENVVVIEEILTSFMEENPDQIRHNADKLYLNVKKMMVYMMEATKEMCLRIDHMENLQGRSFADDILPGYQSEEELEALEEQRQKEQRKSFWSSLFGKKEK